MALVLFPVLFIVGAVFSSPSEYIRILSPYTFGVLGRSLGLALVVGALTGVVGVGLAWMTSAYDFWGRRVLQVCLMLPLAFPSYVLAFVHIGIFDYSGPVQSFLRGIGVSGFLFEIRSFGGLVLVMSLSLYPYIYLLSRNAFLHQGLRAFEAAQSLGKTRGQAFFSVALPMARPWILAGVMLVMMEVFADFGAVAIFNFETFTMAIYKAWFGFFSLSDAARLSSVLVLMAVVLFFYEYRSRSALRFTQMGRCEGALSRVRLKGWMAILVIGGIGIVLFFGFVLPVIVLLFWSFHSVFLASSLSFFRVVLNSIGVSLMSAFIAGVMAILLVSAYRLYKDPLILIANRLSGIGYALPGTVLAVGIYTVLTRVFGSWIHAFPVVMILGLVIRFFATAYHSVSSAMERISPSVEEAAKSMGCFGWDLIQRVYFPLLRGGVMTGLILVFVDVMKEMPIILMTRPFGWDTLSVKIFEFTAEGSWNAAAPYALLVLLVGLVPVSLLLRESER